MSTPYLSSAINSRRKAAENQITAQISDLQSQITQLEGETPKNETLIEELKAAKRDLDSEKTAMTSIDRYISREQADTAEILKKITSLQKDTLEIIAKLDIALKAGFPAILASTAANGALGAAAYTNSFSTSLVQLTEKQVEVQKLLTDNFGNS